MTHAGLLTLARRERVRRMSRRRGYRPHEPFVHVRRLDTYLREQTPVLVLRRMHRSLPSLAGRVA